MHEPRTLSPKVLTALRRHLHGRLIVPGDADYALGRRVWNAAIDRHPAAIAVCADAEDVPLALRIASESHTALCVRGGGHNVAGRAVTDGALMLDLSQLRGVTVHAAQQIATVQGGALWHDVDVATARHKLATTGGLVSSTGVGGFTLGGGTGWLMRRFGLASDNVLTAAVVLADGRFVRASADEHPELFWGLRGGAGGLGVVTSFDFRLHPLEKVYAGVVIRPATEAGLSLRAFRDYAAQAPEEFCGMTILSRAPSLPFLGAEWHGRPVAISALCWCGDLASGERELAPLRRFGTPLADHVGPMSYVQWQHLQDAAAPPGRSQYWKTASYRTLPDEVIEELAGALETLPTPQTEIHVQHLGGAVAQVDASASAFAQRDTLFFVNLIGVTPWSDEFEVLCERTRLLHERISPRALRSLLPNFSDQDDAETLGPGAPRGAERLQELRRSFDPAGLFSQAPQQDRSPPPQTG